MNKEVALHLPFFASQEHNIERCIPKGRNNLKVEVEVSFSFKKIKLSLYQAVEAYRVVRC
jgi:hypothetical protein